MDQWVAERDVRRLLVQVVKRCVERGGLYRDVTRGIGRGSPLSPVFAALYLKAAGRRAGPGRIALCHTLVALGARRLAPTHRGCRTTTSYISVTTIFDTDAVGLSPQVMLTSAVTCA